MKKIIPYNAGEIRESSSGRVMICGHIWWPVEKRNAYHCIRVNDYGEPVNETPHYIWDYTDGGWSEITPKERPGV